MATTPAAHLEDDWPAESVANSVSERRLPPLSGEAEEAVTPAAKLRAEDGGSVAGHEDSFCPGGTGALAPEEEQQQLVAAFDRKLSACFRNVDCRTGDGAPVGPIGEDSLLEEDP